MSEYKEKLIELFENVSGCEIQEFGSDQLPFLADYIIGQQEADNACIEKLKSELKTERENNERLTAIATKHATRADELYELMLEVYKFGGKIIGPALCLAEVDYPMSAQAIAANTDWNEIQHKIKLVLDKSRIKAEGK